MKTNFVLQISYSYNSSSICHNDMICISEMPRVCSFESYIYGNIGTLTTLIAATFLQKILFEILIFSQNEFNLESQCCRHVFLMTMVFEILILGQNEFG